MASAPSPASQKVDAPESGPEDAMNVQSNLQSSGSDFEEHLEDDISLVGLNALEQGPHGVNVQNLNEPSNIRTLTGSTQVKRQPSTSKHSKKHGRHSKSSKSRTQNEREEEDENDGKSLHK